MKTIPELIAHFERRTGECAEEVSRIAELPPGKHTTEEDRGQMMAGWNDERLIARDTASYLGALAKFKEEQGMTNTTPLREAAEQALGALKALGAGDGYAAQALADALAGAPTPSARTGATERLPYELRVQIGRALDRLVCDDSTPEQVDQFIATFSDLGLRISADDDFTSTTPAAIPGGIATRNEEAGYVEFINSDVPYIVRDLPAPAAILIDMETRQYIGYRVYEPKDSPVSSLIGSQAVRNVAQMITVGNILDHKANGDLIGWCERVRNALEVAATAVEAGK